VFYFKQRKVKNREVFQYLLLFVLPDTSARRKNLNLKKTATTYETIIKRSSLQVLLYLDDKLIFMRTRTFAVVLS